VELRKQLGEHGLDAGAHTIAYHLEKRHGTAPSVATIWRILSRRGFVTPQPQKRPKSSFVRFEADLPIERWQADITHWTLADDTEVEILNVIDDHSRFLVTSDALVVFKAADVVASFHAAAAAHGFPASMLTDNGAVFTAAPRGGRCAMELETAALGIAYRHSTPYHPQTCGKVERFHQTEKKWLAKQPAPTTLAELQSQLDRFGLLQHREAAPRDRTAHARGGVRCAAQGRTVRSWARDPPALPRATRQGRHHRCDHASPQLPAAPHRARSQTHRHPGARARRRPRRSRADRRR
jgi:transposase InsO family protein